MKLAYIVMAVSAAQCPGVSSQGAPIVHLGGLGGTNTEAFDINESGAVVGTSSRTDGFTAPFIWTAAAGMRPLTQPWEINGNGYGINDAGHVTGSPTGNVIVWNPNPTSYGSHGGGLGGASPSAINNAGTLVGNRWGSGPIVAFMSVGNGLQSIPRVQGDDENFAADINNSGQVVGHSRRDGFPRAMVYTIADGARYIQLPMVGASDATAINDIGTIVGYQLLENHYTPFLTRGNGGVVYLGTGTGNRASATDVNNSDIVIGALFTSNGTRAAIWSDLANPINLDEWLDQTYPEFGAYWTLRGASAINDANQLVGYGIYDDGPTGLPDGSRAFLLDASSIIPEPASTTIIIALTLIRRARNR